MRFTVAAAMICVLFYGCEKETPSVPQPEQKAAGVFEGLKPGMDRHDVEALVERNGWATGPINTIPIVGPGSVRTGLLVMYGNKVINSTSYLLIRYDVDGKNYHLASHKFTARAPQSQVQMMNLTGAGG